MPPKETIKKDFTKDWPNAQEIPEELSVEFTTMSEPLMQQAFLLAQKQNEKQKESGIRAVVSVMKLKDGTIVTGMAGELEDTDGVTWHEKEGRCARYDGGSGTANADYDSCPGCRHTAHSERSALRKAIRDYGEGAVKDAEIYLYGHWWACTPCMEAIAKAGVSRIYLLKNARDIFDRSLPNHEEARTAFEQEWKERLST